MENPQTMKRGPSYQTPARLICFCVFLSVVVCLSFAFSVYSFKRVLSLDKEFHSRNELKATGEEQFATLDNNVADVEGRTGDITKRDGWHRRNYIQYWSLNGNSTLADHYLKIDGTSMRVVANALGTDPETKFKVHSAEGIDGSVVVILESSISGAVVAINKEDDTVVAKTLPTPLRSLTSLNQVKRDYSEMLFKKVPRAAGSSMFYLRSYHSDERILGFDDNGLPMISSQVEAGSIASLFRMIN